MGRPTVPEDGGPLGHLWRSRVDSRSQWCRWSPLGRSKIEKQPNETAWNSMAQAKLGVRMSFVSVMWMFLLRFLLLLLLFVLVDVFDIHCVYCFGGVDIRVFLFWLFLLAWGCWFWCSQLMMRCCFMHSKLRSRWSETTPGPVWLNVSHQHMILLTTSLTRELSFKKMIGHALGSYVQSNAKATFVQSGFYSFFQKDLDYQILTSNKMSSRFCRCEARDLKVSVWFVDAYSPFPADAGWQ